MTIDTHDDTLRIHGVTELTAGNARDVKSQVRTHFREGLLHIEFDASGITFLDSSGLGALISMQKLVSERNGRFSLLHPTPSALQIIELTRLHRIFEIVS